MPCPQRMARTTGSAGRMTPHPHSASTRPAPPILYPQCYPLNAYFPWIIRSASSSKRLWTLRVRGVGSNAATWRDKSRSSPVWTAAARAVRTRRTLILSSRTRSARSSRIAITSSRVGASGPDADSVENVASDEEADTGADGSDKLFDGEDEADMTGRGFGVTFGQGRHGTRPLSKERF